LFNFEFLALVNFLFFSFKLWFYVCGIELPASARVKQRAVSARFIVSDDDDDRLFAARVLPAATAAEAIAQHQCLCRFPVTSPKV